MTQNSFKLGSIAGIEIGIHYTWLFAFALVAWSLAGGFFPLNYPGWDRATYWVTGVIAALALFASVLIHELSHSFVALARGQGVHSITLFIFGGVSNLRDEARDPGDEFLVSVVGPLTSFALAGAFWLARGALGPTATPLTAMLDYLAVINVLLGVFNLIPGFPLDGGRVLRSIVWKVTGSLRRATNVASFVGQGIAVLLIVWGVWQMFEGNFLGGLWIAFIGWFLNSAAESARQQQQLQETLSGVRVAEIMNPTPTIIAPETRVQEFVLDHVLRRGERAVLVGDATRLQGIVSVTDARELPQSEWPSTPVATIMTRGPLHTVSPQTDLRDALRLLVERSLNQLPVIVADRPVGLLTRADVLRFMQLRDELPLRPAA